MKNDNISHKLIDLSNPLHTLIIGVAVGLIAIGLQNYNPLEPRACTHYCSIFVGYGVFLCLLLVNIFVILYYKTKKD